MIYGVFSVNSDLYAARTSRRLQSMTVPRTNDIRRVFGEFGPLRNVYIPKNTEYAFRFAFTITPTMHYLNKPTLSWVGRHQKVLDLLNTLRSDSVKLVLVFIFRCFIIIFRSQKERRGHSSRGYKQSEIQSRDQILRDPWKIFFKHFWFKDQRLHNPGESRFGCL